MSTDTNQPDALPTEIRNLLEKYLADYFNVHPGSTYSYEIVGMAESAHSAGRESRDTEIATLRAQLAEARVTLDLIHKALADHDTGCEAGCTDFKSYTELALHTVELQRERDEAHRERDALKEELKNELSDLNMVCEIASTVYDHLTRGQISKPNTKAEVIIGVVEALQSNEVNEATAEMEADVKRLTGELAEMERQRDALRGANEFHICKHCHEPYPDHKEHCGVPEALAAHPREAAALGAHAGPDVSDNGWLPIETAPRDGTPFSACRMGEAAPWFTRLIEGYAEPPETTWWCETGDCWRAIQRFHDEWNPTHWRPLPLPPATQEKEGK